MTLYELLKARRQDVIDAWLVITQSHNTVNEVSHTQLLDQIPSFVDELIGALHPEALPLPPLGEIAVEHGAQRLELGFNVAEVVREYGFLHQGLLAIAREADLIITLPEQEIVARWLNTGIANAVSQYVDMRDAELRRQSSQHLGFVAHEIRNPLSSVRMAFQLLKRSALAEGGRVVDLLDRNLSRAVDVIDGSLSQASLRMGLEPRRTPLTVSDFLRELEVDTSAEAQAKGIDVLVVCPEDLVLKADGRLIHSAVSNLLRNALKFSEPSTTIVLRAFHADGRIMIEVEDACGGLPGGASQDLFRPLIQRGPDQTGFGLGLAIARQAIEAHSGTVKVRDLPGKGCIFTIELPAEA